MPLYEYICKECGLRFEALVIGSNRPACPSCQSLELEQEISAFSMGNNSGSDIAAGETGCNSNTG
jgi:putative FmdB family regulatory protein